MVEDESWEGCDAMQATGRASLLHSASVSDLSAAETSNTIAPGLLLSGEAIAMA